MNSDAHPIHEAVAKEIKSINMKDQVVYDPACKITNNCAKNIQLFYGRNKSRKNHFCSVDIIVLDNKNDRVKVIIEVDESNTSPVHVLGKAFASKLANNYQDGQKCYEINGRTKFIQVVKVSAKLNTKKPEKFEIIEKVIKDAIKQNKRGVGSYKMVCVVDEKDPELKTLLRNK